MPVMMMPATMIMDGDNDVNGNDDVVADDDDDGGDV